MSTHLHVYQCYRVEQLMIPSPGEMDNTRGNRKGKWYTAGTEEGEGQELHMHEIEGKRKADAGWGWMIDAAT